MDTNKPPSKAPARRSRVAQPGNTHSLKHGFYSHTFRSLELRDLDVLQATLESEIALLRVHLRRAVEANAQPEDPKEISAWLSALSTTVARIAYLARTQYILTGKNGGSLSLVAEAVAAIAKEKNL